MADQTSLRERVTVWAVLAFMVPGIVLLFSAFMQVFSQVLHWMRNGEWFPLPATLLFWEKQDLRVLRFVPDLFWGPGFVEWLTMPNDWKGIAQVVLWLLEALSSPVVCVLLGFVLMMIPLWVLQWASAEVALWRESRAAK